jgi:NHL repeat
MQRLLPSMILLVCVGWISQGKLLSAQPADSYVINTVAGTGTAGFSGDGSAASSAQLLRPTGVALDSMGNLYIADTANHRIRKVSRSEEPTTRPVSLMDKRSRVTQAQTVQSNRQSQCSRGVTS